MAPLQKTFSLRLIFVLLLCSSMLFLTLLLSSKSYTSLTSSIIEGSTISTRYAVEAVTLSMEAMLGPASSTLGVLSSTNIAFAETNEQRLDLLPSMANALKNVPMAESVFIGYATGDFFCLLNYSERLNTSNQYGEFEPEAAFLLVSVTQSTDGTFVQNFWHLNSELEKIGKVNFSTPTFDPRERNWFLLAQKFEGTVSTRPYVFFGSQELGVTMSLSVAQGKAVLGFDILTIDVRETLMDLRATPGMEIAIVDSTDEVLASTSSFALHVKTLGPDGSILLAALGIPAFNYLLTDTASSKSIITYTEDEKTWFGSASNLGNFYGNPMRLFISIPASELLHAANQQREALLLFTAGVFIIFLVGGALVANWMFNPIRKVIKHLSLLSEFNFAKPLYVETVFTEISQLGKALNHMSCSLLAFQEIMRVLNSEREQQVMLEALLRNTLEIVRLERGFIYLCEEGKFNLAASIGCPQFESVIEVANVDVPDQALITLLQACMGTNHVHVLLRDAAGKLLGALCVDQRTGKNQEPPYNKQVLSGYLEQIAAAAAVGIETRQLIAAQKNLLDGLVQLIARGIDAKSAHTWGHCNRVPELVLMLASAANKSEQPPFDKVVFTREQREELRIAAWLHDCGKLTTPEHVVDKATKLETLHNRLHEIRTRFEVLHRDATIRYMAAIMRGDNKKEAKQACRKEQEELFRDFAFVAQCNIGNDFIDDAHTARLRAIGQRVWVRHFNACLGLSRGEIERQSRDHDSAKLPSKERLLADKSSHIIHWPDELPPPVTTGDPKNILGLDMCPPPFMYNMGEIHNLSIPRGTLSAEERFKINDHVVQTLDMLRSLPWPHELRRTPDIAGNHHEALNGKGYPRKLADGQLALTDRILALADVFEALTAPDRPYKDAKKLSEALDVLASMVKMRHLDGDVFALFLQSGIYLEYAKKYMAPELIDYIDVASYLQMAAKLK